MTTLEELHDDVRTLISLVRERPTRDELKATEDRILLRMSDFGTTIGGDIGHVLQRIDAIELRRDNEAAAAARNARLRPARVR